MAWAINKFYHNRASVCCFAHRCITTVTVQVKFVNTHTFTQTWCPFISFLAIAMSSTDECVATVWRPHTLYAKNLPMAILHMSIWRGEVNEDWEAKTETRKGKLYNHFTRIQISIKSRTLFKPKRLWFHFTFFFRSTIFFSYSIWFAGRRRCRRRGRFSLYVSFLLFHRLILSTANSSKHITISLYTRYYMHVFSTRKRHLFG